MHIFVCLFLSFLFSSIFLLFFVGVPVCVGRPFMLAIFGSNRFSFYLRIFWLLYGSAGWSGRHCAVTAWWHIILTITGHYQIEEWTWEMRWKFYQRCGMNCSHSLFWCQVAVRHTQTLSHWNGCYLKTRTRQSLSLRLFFVGLHDTKAITDNSTISAQSLSCYLDFHTLQLIKIFLNQWLSGFT